MKNLAANLAAALVLLTAACGDDLAPQCSADFQCGTGQRCLDGLCIAFPDAGPRDALQDAPAAPQEAGDAAGQADGLGSPPDGPGASQEAGRDAASTPDAAPDAAVCTPACDDGNPCTQDLCSMGQCVTLNYADNTACPGGLCRTGRCSLCGGPGQRCCAVGEACSNVGLTCRPLTPSGGTPYCLGCGISGTACCPGGVCEVGTTCTAGMCG